MTPLVAGPVFGAVIIIAAPCDDVVSAREASTTLTPAALAEIAQVEAEIDRIEARTLERLAAPVVKTHFPWLSHAIGSWQPLEKSGALPSDRA